MVDCMEMVIILHYLVVGYNKEQPELSHFLKAYFKSHLSVELSRLRASIILSSLCSHRTYF